MTSLIQLIILVLPPTFNLLDELDYDALLLDLSATFERFEEARRSVYAKISSSYNGELSYDEAHWKDDYPTFDLAWLPWDACSSFLNDR